MPFKKKVEIGRIALVNLAEDELYNRLVVIVDVVDQNRVRSPQCACMPQWQVILLCWLNLGCTCFDVYICG